MKLYYAPGACSLSPHIVAREAGIELELERVDLKTKRTESGADYFEINPKGSVPVLQLDNGELLSEGPVIAQYLADLKPQSKLAPANGTLARYRLQEALGLINSELHKSYSPLFDPSTPDTVRSSRKLALLKQYTWLDQRLAKQPWLLGDEFSAADAYLFTVLGWGSHVGVDIGPKLKSYVDRVRARPHVIEAMTAEGLIKK